LNVNAQHCGTGMLDPRIAAVLRDSIKDLQPRLRTPDPNKPAKPATVTTYPAGDMSIIKITADSIPVYIFNANHGTQLPAVLFFHAGAFVFPFMPFMKNECWRMSRDLNAIVFAIDYRIAPANKFPAAVNDAYHAFEWILDNGATWGADMNKLVISGMSAGANLTAVVCQKAKNAGLANRIKLQVLNCAPLDNKDHQSRYPSYQKYATGYFQTREFIDFAQLTYADAGSFSNPEFAPMLTSDLHKLPPAVIVTVEFDLFHDEDQVYANRLRKAGVKVWTKCFAGQIHCLVGLRSDAPEFKELNEVVRAAMSKTLQ
jgi:acetyl esterase